MGAGERLFCLRVEEMKGFVAYMCLGIGRSRGMATVVVVFGAWIGWGSD